ncbi:class I adenylate-forming enzyme family protein [Candidatus Poriferisocius sp.]|uniref:class I adenylate-forming enzyme family protein n=1 Tax=Candidatus Poriferisocius sp. TaxID=3101276 RepID=UPI003B018899
MPSGIPGGTAGGLGPVDFPAYEPTVPGMIRAAVGEHGHRMLAVLGDHRVTYANADTASKAIAKGLLAIGVGKGTRVGLLAPNSPDWIAAWLAIGRIGALGVLLNTYYRAKELDWVLRHGDVQVLLCASRHLGHDYPALLEEIATPGDGRVIRAPSPDRVEDAGGGDGWFGDDRVIRAPSHPYLRSVWVWGQPDRPWLASMDSLVAAGEAIDDGLLAAVEAQVSPADEFVVVYTSGSTAAPKGAVHTQGAVVRHAHNLWRFRDLVAGDRLYTPMPMFWVGGMSFTLVAVIHVGAGLVFEERFEPGETLALIERERVTLVAGWPHMAKLLTDHPDFPTRDLSSVRGGSLYALLPPEEQIEDPELRVNSLGMTETLGPHTLDMMGTPLPEKRRASFGRPVPGMEHRIVDPETGEDCPPGRRGEVWVRGYALMVGLYKVERADAFTPDGWYRTGDSGYFDGDGYFYFTGRMGDLIKSSGMNITPREIELVLEESDAVMHAFVCGVPHPDRLEDVAAAVVLRPGRTLTAEDLRAFVASRVASYKVPRHLALFDAPGALPWLDSGKIDLTGVKRLLAERFKS